MSGQIINADALEALKTLPDKSVHTCITSPPYYGLRDYGAAGQIGLEQTPQEYMQRLLGVFAEVKRVLRDDGTLWVNIADSYNNYKENAKSNTSGSKYAGFRTQPTRPSGYGLEDKTAKNKDLIGIPWLLAFALRDEGYYWRDTIIWHKPNPMPESVKDRCTKAHEYILMFSKSSRYYFDAAAIAEPCVQGDSTRRDRNTGKLNSTPGRTPMRGLTRNDYEKRNKRNVWTVSTKPYKGAHFATFPVDLITPCILAGAPEGGTVLDPFAGSGTTGEAATQNKRNYILIDINPDYIKIAERRTAEAEPQATIFNYKEAIPQ